MKSSFLLWKIAFSFLLIAGAIGLLMRLQFFSSIPNFNYQYVLHAHSHVVLLGWVFNALLAAIHYLGFREEMTSKHVVLYALFQLSVLGMLLSFPVQGYAAVSITFSTLHILLSYVWAVWLWKRSKGLDWLTRSFLKWGLIYLVISTIGPFSLGPIIVSGGAGSGMYYMAVYFYLHFLYNGFFIFCLLALFFWYLRTQNLDIDIIKGKRVLQLMNIQCFLGLFLSSLWMQPHSLFYVIGGLGGVIQVLALIYLFHLLRPVWKQLLSGLSKGTVFLVKMSLAGLMLKVFLQAISALPVVADLAYEVRNITIGYLHLVFLGIITPFLFAWFNTHGMMSLKSVPKKLGIMLFFVGFTLSELAIVTPSAWGPAIYFKVLFGVSLILWVGLVLLFPGRSPGSTTSRTR